MNKFSRFLISLALLIPLSCQVQRDKEIKPVSKPPEYNLPADISYKIVERNEQIPSKSDIVVMLNKPVDIKTLTTIANRIKSEQTTDFKATLISYYVEGHSREFVWATTFFRPDLEVRIIGPTQEELNKAANSQNTPKNEYLGRWVQEMPYLGIIHMTLIYKDKKYYMERAFSDGSSKLYGLRKGKNGKYFEIESVDGEYFKINSNGDLDEYDTEGYIRTNKKID